MTWQWDRRATALGLLAGALLIGTASTASADETVLALHQRIDAAIEAAIEGPLAAPACDSEFLRRVYLDLTGSIPTAQQAADFLDDPTSNKRHRLIERLLAGPGYARRMQHVFDVMLNERRPDKHVPADEWQHYLWESFAENKPLDGLVRELLSTDGTQAELRPAAKFLLEREADANLLTRDVGRLLLGRDMQCAQCHDHPLIGDYLQQHYYGLYAFFSRTFLFADKQQKKSFLAEKADGDVTYKSVFNPQMGTVSMGPQLLDGPPLEEPTFAKGAEYLVAPAKDVRPVPKFSRRAKLAEQLTGGGSEDFHRNLANRLWAVVMGRGLVEPVDLHHSDNPPSHPELLQMLTEELVAMEFDSRSFVRELMLTETYQRSSELPEGMTEEQAAPARYAVASLKPLSPEQLAWSLMEAAGVTAGPRDAELARQAADRRLADILSADESRKLLKESLVERAVYEKLKGNTISFVRLYGGASGEPEQDFQATVHQALFFSNADTVAGWLRAGGSLPVRLAKIDDTAALAEQLYLSVLSRRPDDAESAAVEAYLAERGHARQTAIEEMAWALMASTEFRFNH